MCVCVCVHVYINQRKEKTFQIIGDACVCVWMDGCKKDGGRGGEKGVYIDVGAAEMSR